MTKKHSNAISALIKEYFEGDERDLWALIYPMADYIQEQNPNFDRQHFIQACKPDYLK